MEDAIVRLRELLDEARGIAYRYHRGQTGPYGTPSLPWPDWILSDQAPHSTFVQVEGVDTAPAGSLFERLTFQRDEARLWAHSDAHRMWPFPTDIAPLWLYSSTLPADPEIVRQWQREHPERQVEW
ncbi:MAG TPA: hypothetical protein DEQ43_02800 [Nocardioides bacterium]|nr:hypothetical protein [Nocardioides sp.]